jgi:hypothetical protein
MCGQQRSLSPPEQRLWEASCRGELLDLRADPNDGPEHAPKWPPDRHISAEAIARLIRGAASPEPGTVVRLRLAGARITGKLDLSHAQIQYPLEFEDCLFDASVDLEEAAAGSVKLRGCFVPVLDATRADLRGELQAQGCRFGWVSLYGARISEVELSGSHLGRHFTPPPDGVALHADLLAVERTMYCHDVRIKGEVRLIGAHIAGRLEFDGTRIANGHGPTLNADGITVDNGMFCRRGYKDDHHAYTTTGEIAMNNARITGGLVLDDAHLSNPGGATLAADQITIDGGLFCRSVTSNGQLRLRAARITGPFTMATARLRNADGIALDAERVTVDGGVFCHDGFNATGEIRLRGARISGQLDLGTIPLWSSADRLQRDLWTSVIAGGVDLRDAQVGLLRDEVSAWPEAIRLDGLHYERLSPQLTAEQRLGWLACDPDGYQPQPYEQLAACYRRIGHDEDARRVLLVKQRRRRKQLNTVGRIWSYVQDGIVGYGYRPWLAGLWFLGLLAAGTAYFAAYPPHSLQPAGLAFDPFAYTLDLLVPVISLGQENAWDPLGGGQAIAYALIFAGWILTTAVAAGISRVLTRS